MPIIIAPKQIRIIKPDEMASSGMDHGNRPFRIALFDNNIVLPEYYSIDKGRNWKGVAYSEMFDLMVKDRNCKVFLLQGVDRQYILHPDGKFEISPLFQDKFFPKLQIVFDNKPISFDYVYEHLKYFVHAQSQQDAPKFQGGMIAGTTGNVAVNFGWRKVIDLSPEDKVDLSVNMRVFTNEKGVSFRVQASKFHPTDESDPQEYFEAQNQPKQFYELSQTLDLVNKQLLIHRIMND